MASGPPTFLILPCDLDESCHGSPCMSHIPGSIRAARLKQPRLTSEQFWRQVEQHLRISFGNSEQSGNGVSGKESLLKEEPLAYRANGQEWNTK